MFDQYITCTCTCAWFKSHITWYIFRKFSTPWEGFCFYKVEKGGSAWIMIRLDNRGLAGNKLKLALDVHVCTKLEKAIISL